MLGQFTLNASSTKPLDQITLADVQRYTQGFNFGVGTYAESQWLFAGYAQDRYSLRDDVTLDLGLRYDRQTFSDGNANFAPRVGAAWNPHGDPKTVVRGGYGLYFTQLRSNLQANFDLNGPLGIGSYTASPGQTGFPTCIPPISSTGVVGSGCTPVVFDPNAAASTLPARNITIRPGMASYYTPIFAQYGVDFSKLPNYPDSLVNPKSQVLSAGIEREIRSDWTVSADYVHQHWSDLDRTVDLNAPSEFDRTAPGQVRSVAAADLTRPILPVNGGFRQINVIMNLGVADYDALQTNLTYRGSRKLFAQVSYTLSKSTNTTEPDGNGVNPNDATIATLGEQERGPSVLDQRHRAVLTLTYLFPYNITAGTVTQLGSARPFNAVTGVDNNGDGSNNDRPVIDGTVVSKSAFRGTAQSDVAIFVEGRLKATKSGSLLLRMEVFNLFNHPNVLARQTNYGDSTTPAANFGQALAGLANIDPARMVQFQVRTLRERVDPQTHAGPVGARQLARCSWQHPPRRARTGARYHRRHGRSGGHRLASIARAAMRSRSIRTSSPSRRRCSSPSSIGRAASHGRLACSCARLVTTATSSSAGSTPKASCPRSTRSSRSRSLGMRTTANRRRSRWPARSISTRCARPNAEWPARARAVSAGGWRSGESTRWRRGTRHRTSAGRHLSSRRCLAACSRVSASSPRRAACTPPASSTRMARCGCSGRTSGGTMRSTSSSARPSRPVRCRAAGRCSW